MSITSRRDRESGRGTRRDASALRELTESRGLLWAWTRRIVRGRYQQSVLGGLWAIIQPAATVGIVTVVFTRFVPIETGGVPYVVFSSVAIVPWTLLSTSLTDMVNALVDNIGLVTKIYFPREILPLAAVFARLLDFGIAAAVVVLLLVYYQVPAPGSAGLYLPVILIVQVALTVGVGLAASAVNVFYRDVKHLVVLGLQLWFYASPVLYQASAVPERYRSLYVLNPMVGVLEAYRGVLVHGRPPDAGFGIAAVASACALVFGYVLFKRVESRFADVL
jgi:lipopolysaccharide transport system permease protein